MVSLAQQYSAAHPSAAWGCGPAVRVEQVASGDAERDLSQGWPDPATRPDVWAPAASTWVLLLREHLAARPQASLAPPDKPNLATQQLAASPLVVAMPDQMAKNLGWPDRQPSWSELLQLAADPAGWGARGHPEWGPFRLGKTDPGKSTSGIHTLVAEYFAATGKSSSLEPSDVESPATQSFLRVAEGSVSHYAPTAGDFLTSLAANGGGDGSYISAIPVEEQEVFKYNEGHYSLDRLPPRDRLDAVYPAGGTLYADHPFVVLPASWVSDGQRGLADNFLKWLRDPERQKRFLHEGFRAAGGGVDSTLSGEPGVRVEQPSQTLNLPVNAAVLALIVTSWKSFRKRARLRLVLDLRSSEQKDAVVHGVAALSDQDEVDVVSSSGGDPAPSIGRLGSTRDAVVAAVRSAPLSAEPTPLYAEVQRAYVDLETNGDPGLINAVVVIAAGPNRGSGPSLTALERDVRPHPGRVQVRIYTVALSGSDRQALGDLERASGGYASPSEDPEAAIRTCLANF